MSVGGTRPPCLARSSAAETSLTGGPLVAVVGPCGAGKSALVAALRQRGVRAREVAQEHSYAPAMWQRITGPDVLIYLDVSQETAERRKGRPFPSWEWQRLIERLVHARAHADLVVDTAGLSTEQVLDQVMDFLRRANPQSMRLPPPLDG